jgi:hypothetical protein
MPEQFPFRESLPAGLFAAVPEIGVSYWLNRSTRLNAGASYYITSSRSDFLVLGLSLEYVLENGIGWQLIKTPEKTNPVFPASPNRHRIESTEEQLSSAAFVKPEKLPTPPGFDNSSRDWWPIREWPMEKTSQNENVSFDGSTIETIAKQLTSSDLPLPLVPQSILFSSESLSATLK